ncbi:hypothetical protein EBN03_12570 [Nocardia stercoris]|uniref:Uncharacterized protein n=1 Tax=Nocardia stercoris TaxID=2483361 RepID=A0A3M2L5A3_9NOCA|nr:hypothetical protein EBN03_12570 [Nocardia stercoris]
MGGETLTYSALDQAYFEDCGGLVGLAPTASNVFAGGLAFLVGLGHTASMRWWAVLCFHPCVSPRALGGERV